MTAATSGARPAQRPVAAAEAACLAAIAYVPLLLGARGPAQRRHQAVPLPRPGRADGAGPVAVGHVGRRRRRHPPDHRLPLADGALLLARRRRSACPTGPRSGSGSARSSCSPRSGALVLFRTLMPRRHPAQLVAALGYGLSPFVLGHVTGQSALLLPFAAFGVAGLDARPRPRRGHVAVAGRLRAARHDLRVAQRHLGVLRHPRGRALGAVRRAHPRPGHARDGIVLLVRAGVAHDPVPALVAGRVLGRRPLRPARSCRSPRRSRRPRRRPRRRRSSAASATGSSTAATSTGPGSTGLATPYMTVARAARRVVRRAGARARAGQRGCAGRRAPTSPR